MPNLGRLMPPELADLLQQADAADHDPPGEHLTDPVVRYDLARLLDQDEMIRAAAVGAWLKDLHDWET